ncbi:hypothetical protein FHG87_015349 [Trinorchestia longiramus]|nr:hypothetical protein FHG87_015349 [Trinorchestia longiramus]
MQWAGVPGLILTGAAMKDLRQVAEDSDGGPSDPPAGDADGASVARDASVRIKTEVLEFIDVKEEPKDFLLDYQAGGSYASSTFGEVKGVFTTDILLKDEDYDSSTKTRPLTCISDHPTRLQGVHDYCEASEISFTTNTLDVNPQPGQVTAGDSRVGKSFKCSLCDFSSNGNIGLKYHLVTKHGVGESLRCNLCDFWDPVCERGVIETL